MVFGLLLATEKQIHIRIVVAASVAGMSLVRHLSVLVANNVPIVDTPDIREN